MLPEYLRVTQSFQDFAYNQLSQPHLTELARRWLQVEASLEQEFNRVAEKVAAMVARGEEVTATALYRMERFQTLMNQVDNKLVWVDRYADDSLKKLMQTTARLGNSSAIVGSEVLGLHGAFNHFNEAAIQNIVALARENKPLDRLLERSHPLAKEGIVNEILKNAAAGYSPREIANFAKRNGMSQGLNHLMLVSRDQQIRAYRLAQLQTYERSGIVPYVKRICAKNLRTCVMCLALDGKKYPVGEPLELHPQDRCAFIPVVEGMPEISWTTGEQWLKAQPPAVQKQVLGTMRYDAYQRGFSLNEMLGTPDSASQGARTWGPNPTLKPAKKLVDATPLPPTDPKKYSYPNPEAEPLSQAEVNQLKSGAKFREDMKSTIRETLEAYREEALTLGDYVTNAKLDDQMNRIVNGTLQIENSYFKYTAASIDLDQRMKGLVKVSNPLKGREHWFETGRNLVKKGQPFEYVDRIAKGGLKDFCSLISDSAWGANTKGKWVRFHFSENAGRAFYKASGEAALRGVHIFNGDGKSTVVHELGHWFEFNAKGAQSEANKFLKMRTKGETAEWLGDSYDKIEIAKKDKFLDPYIGKQYGGAATEVLSMGYEMMLNAPYQLMTGDPGMFDFLYDLARGVTLAQRKAMGP